MTLPRWINPTMKQTWVILPSLINKMCWGMSLGIVSCIMREVQDPNSNNKMDVETASWFASLLGISMMIGFFVSSCLMYKFGRRIASMIACVPAIMSLFIIFTNDVTSMMIFRALTGFSNGAVGIISFVINGEFSSPQNRGMYMNLMTVGLNTGSLLMHVVGNFTSSRNLAILIAAPYIICLFVTYTSPESPSWLAERKKFKKSREAFYWLRGRTEETTREIEELVQAQNCKITYKTVLQHITGFILKFKKKNFLKPILIIVLVSLLLETSGRHIFPSYAAQLIKDITSGDFNQFHYNIVLDILILFSGVIASFLIRVVRIRTLLFVSGTVTFIVLMLASLSLYYLNNGLLTISWIPLVLFASFFFLSNLGCSCVPLVLLGEIFPLEHRVVGTALGSYIMIFLMAVVLKTMPQLVIRFHIYGSFGIMGVCMAVILIILYFILPETKNRTLQQIENHFSDKVKDDIDCDASEKLNEHC